MTMLLRGFRRFRLKVIYATICIALVTVHVTIKHLLTYDVDRTGLSSQHRDDSKPCDFDQRSANATGSDLHDGRTARHVRPSYYLIYDGDFKRGLGNWMFKLASLYGIAQGSNKTVALLDGSSITSCFQLDAQNLHNDSSIYSNLTRVFGGAAASYKAGVVAQARDVNSHVLLRGYYQSWKYFQNITDKIRKLFTFKAEIAEEAQRILTDAKLQFYRTNRQTPVLIGTHVRRGDVVTSKRYQERGFTSPSTEYYLNAMQFYRQIFPSHSLLFIVCSNDVEWVKTNLITNFTKDHIKTMPPNHSAALDMAILSHCDHVIISAGTFSWWSAWLANGVTVYYDRWPTPGTWFASQVRHEDYFLPSWIPMH